jgi:hypothetical protein
MSDEAMALALLLSTLDRIAIAVERLADAEQEAVSIVREARAKRDKPETTDWVEGR